MENVKKTRYFTEIRKLARKFRMPELENDLQTFLWELYTFNTPPSVEYALVCLRHKALEIARKEYRRREDFTDNLEWIPAPENNVDLRLDIERVFLELSTAERDLLTEIYIVDRSVIDVAESLGISRQAVNKRRVNALAKLQCLKPYA
jgi:DNA-directed RNA polymerase specialized sigma24 family protein